MQVEQRDGSFDLGKLQAATDEVIEQARTQTSIANPFTTFRAGAPHIEVDVDRAKAESLNVAVGDVFATLSSYRRLDLRQPLQQVRPEPAGLCPGRFAVPRPARGPAASSNVRSSDGKMVPIGALAQIKPARGAALISLYNLYPSASIVGAPAPGFSQRPVARR